MLCHVFQPKPRSSRSFSSGRSSRSRWATASSVVSPHLQRGSHDRVGCGLIRATHGARGEGCAVTKRSWGRDGQCTPPLPPLLLVTAPPLLAAQGGGRPYGGRQLLRCGHDVAVGRGVAKRRGVHLLAVAVGRRADNMRGAAQRPSLEAVCRASRASRAGAISTQQRARSSCSARARAAAWRG